MTDADRCPPHRLVNDDGVLVCEDCGQLPPTALVQFDDPETYPKKRHEKDTP
jgi:hypothetical protein